MKAPNRKRRTHAPFASTLALALTASGIPLSLPQAWADDFNSVCGSSQTLSGQKATYCQAAKQAKDASKKESTLTALYAAVSGTCTVACATTFFSGGTGDIACSGGALAASATDMIMTQNFTSSFNVLVGGMGLMDAWGAKDAATYTSPTTTIAGKKIKNSCITAATTGVSALMHRQSGQNAKSTYDQNLESAKKVNDSNTASYALQPSSGGGSFGGTTALPSSGNTATQLGSGNGGTAGTTGDACGDTTSVSGAVACAATADPTLAQMVSSSDFQKAFEKSSGMNLGDYLKGASNLSPSDAIKAAAGSGLPASGMDTLTKAIAKAEEAAPNFNSEVSATYAARGGSKSGAAGDDEFANMMNGLMGKLMPKTEEEQKSGVSQVNFGGPARNLASVTAEDPTVSLFDRVAYRYAHVTPRLLAEPAQRKLSDWSMNNPVTNPAGSALNQRN